MAANGIRSAGAGRPIGCDAWTGFLKGRHDSNPDSPAAARSPLSGPAGGDRRFRRADRARGQVPLLVGALIRLRRSRRGRWAFAVGYGAVAIALALLTARHFATSSWPLSSGDPGLLVAAGLLLLL